MRKAISAAVLAAAAGLATGQTFFIPQTGGVIFTEIFAEPNQQDFTALGNLGTLPTGLPNVSATTGAELGFFTLNGGPGETPMEFFEITNVSNAPIDITGWTLVAVDDANTSEPFTSNADDLTNGNVLILGPGESVMITFPERTVAEQDPGLLNDFNLPEAQNDIDDPVIGMAAWGIPRERILFVGNGDAVANGPSATNEIYELRDTAGVLIDIVNYDDTFPWPEIAGPVEFQGRAISLLPEFTAQANINAALSGTSSDNAFLPPSDPFFITPQIANDFGLAWVYTDQPAVVSGAAAGDLKISGGRFADAVFIDVASLENTTELVPVLDAEGNPVLDAEGNPVLEEVVTDVGAVVIVPTADAIDPVTGRQVAGTLYVVSGLPFIEVEGGGFFGGNFASPGFQDFTPDANDANGNGIDDDGEIFALDVLDTNRNTIPDDQELTAGGDANLNGILDSFDVRFATDVFDCNFDGIIDTVNILGNQTLAIPSAPTQAGLDANGNGIIDGCEVNTNIIITEIFYDPANPAGVDEGLLEFVEITNVGGTPQLLDGWGLVELDAGPEPLAFGTRETLAAFPAGITIAPGESIVFIDADLNTDTANFSAAFGSGFRVFALTGIGGLANGPTIEDEVLALFAPVNTAAAVFPNDGSGPAAFVVADLANYSESAGFDITTTGADETALTQWPGSSDNFSYVLRPDSANRSANNFGSNWEFSVAGTFGSTFAQVVDAFNPGVQNQTSAGVFVGATAADGTGSVVVTEILAAPNSVPQDTGFITFGDVDGDPATEDDGIIPATVIVQNEWIEITNFGATPVDVSGWFLQDEDGFTSGFRSPQVDGTILMPGESAVVFGLDNTVTILANQEATDAATADLDGDGDVGGTDFVTIPFSFFACDQEAVHEFQTAWGGGYKVLVVDGWAADIDAAGPFSDDLGGLSNGPGFDNEILTLRRADGSLADLVNFDDGSNVRTGNWPADSTGDILAPAFSIILEDTSASPLDNNLGDNWGPTVAGNSVDAQPESRFVNPTEFFPGIDPQTGLPVVDAVDMEGSPGVRFGGAPLTPAQLAGVFNFTVCAQTVSLADISSTPPVGGVFGQLDGNDISAFVGGFIGNLPISDLSDTPPGSGTFGQFDGNDISAFVAAFVAGV